MIPEFAEIEAAIASRPESHRPYLEDMFMSAGGFVFMLPDARAAMLEGIRTGYYLDHPEFSQFLRDGKPPTLPQPTFAELSRDVEAWRGKAPPTPPSNLFRALLTLTHEKEPNTMQDNPHQLNDADRQVARAMGISDAEALKNKLAYHAAANGNEREIRATAGDQPASTPVAPMPPSTIKLDDSDRAVAKAMGLSEAQALRNKIAAAACEVPAGYSPTAA
jgi:hypothetical protein